MVATAQSSTRRQIIGIDIGGTFTDVVVVRPDGHTVGAKSPTTPEDLSKGVLEGVRGAARMMDTPVEEVLAATSLIKHGSTVATNALLTRSGVRVGLITTAGFEDTSLIMRAVGRVDGIPEAELRHVAAVTKPDPIVPREAIRGVRERIDFRGEVVVPLNEAEVEEAIDYLTDELDVDAVAVSLLNAWANQAHEQRINQLIEAHPRASSIFRSFSSQLSRQAGEYARTNSAILNSYIGPVVTRYLSKLEESLRDLRFGGALLIMQGNGGLVDWRHVNPIDTLQSGPAGGLIASAVMAEQLGHKYVLTGDVGGTSFDIGLVLEGNLSYADEPVFDRFRLAQPIADVRSIGAGGGTIARGNPELRTLRVGPESAGARPGPAAYDTGGLDPTVTDANLNVGVLNPDYFLGGERPLRADLAESAMDDRVATPLALSTAEASIGVLEVINSKMADLARRELVRSGFLPEDFVLYSFGGAGGAHAAHYAEELGVNQIYVFPTSSVFSALGIAIADIVESQVASCRHLLQRDHSSINELIEQLEREVAAEAQASLSDDIKSQESTYRRVLGARFARQSSSVELPLNWARFDEESAGAFAREFMKRYEELYGGGTIGHEDEIEIDQVRVDIVYSVPRPELRKQPVTDESAPEPVARRTADLGAGPQEADVYRYTQLRAGNQLSGPAIVEAPDTTIAVPPGWTCSIDPYGNAILKRGANAS
jgi:N-methylhydantoinase A